MHTYVINLDRSVDRLREFERQNAHMPAIQRFPAVEGSEANQDELLAAGTIAPGLRYSNGALGCALSHIFFWEAAIAENEAITVCEDDAIFHHAFMDLAPKLIDGLGPHWDLVAWGWNFDSILLFDLLPGVSNCLGTFNQEQLRLKTETYQRQAIAPHLYRLLRSFGTICYSISPQGARKLYDRALPLRPLTVDFPMINDEFPNNGIDIAMNHLYGSINAFVSFPPLVVTKNEHATSTVLRKSTEAQ